MAKVKNNHFDYNSFDYFMYCMWFVAIYHWIQWQGWILGIVYYFVVRWIFEKFWLITFKLDLLKAGDEVFFEDDDR